MARKRTLGVCTDCGVVVDAMAYRCVPCHITWKHKYQAKLIASDPSYCYCSQHEALSFAR